MPPSKASASNSAFKRPYISRNQREAAKRSMKSPVNKFLLRVLAALVALLLVSLGLIVTNMGRAPGVEFSSSAQ